MSVLGRIVSLFRSGPVRPTVSVTYERVERPPLTPAPPGASLPPLTRPDKSDVYVRLDALPLAPCVDVTCGQYETNLEIVGESFHQHTLRRIDAGRLLRGERVDFAAWLVPEEANPYDKLAVIVVAQGFGHIGHLSAEDARRYRPAMRLLSKHQVVASCVAHLAGGRLDAPSIGAWLSVVGPTRMLKAIKTHITVNGPQPS